MTFSDRPLFIFGKPSQGEVELRAANPAARSFLPAPNCVMAPGDYILQTSASLAAPLIPAEAIAAGAMLLPETIDPQYHMVQLEALHSDEPLRAPDWTTFVIPQLFRVLVVTYNANGAVVVTGYTRLLDPNVETCDAYAIFEEEDREHVDLPQPPAALDATLQELTAAFWEKVNPSIPRPFADLTNLPEVMETEFVRGSEAELDAAAGLIAGAWLIGRVIEDERIFIAFDSAMPHDPASGGPVQSGFLHDAPPALMAALRVMFEENRFLGIDSTYNDGPPMRLDSYPSYPTTHIVWLDRPPEDGHEAISAAERLRPKAIAWLKAHNFTQAEAATIVGVIQPEEWQDHPTNH